MSICGLIQVDLLSSRKPCTAELLDSHYLHIYNSRYYTPGIPDVLLYKEVERFSMDLVIYLRSKGFDIKAVRVNIMSLSNSPHSVVTLHLVFLDGKEINLLILDEQYSGYGLPIRAQYILVPTKTRANNVRESTEYLSCTSSLGPAIQYILDYYYCASCMYSDRDAKYCGRGLTMYTGNCAGNKTTGTPV